MKRVPEPELMQDPEQVRAYAHADFEGPHSAFMEIFKKYFAENPIRGDVLELGCGPGDITFRFASQFPETEIDAVDGSREMIGYARKLLREKDESGVNINFHRAMIQEFRSGRDYSFIISNSLLHHLHDPMIMWNVIRRMSTKRTGIFIMDLRRPEGFEEAMKLVKKYAESEPDILKKDFFNSLIASFKPHEISEQLIRAGLTDLEVVEIGDRHQIVYGIV
jgi:trans-aconitate methyltransferase